jgi:hypothetical protein
MSFYRYFFSNCIDYRSLTNVSGTVFTLIKSLVVDDGGSNNGLCLSVYGAGDGAVEVYDDDSPGSMCAKATFKLSLSSCLCRFFFAVPLQLVDDFFVVDTGCDSDVGDDDFHDLGN